MQENTRDAGTTQIESDAEGSAELDAILGGDGEEASSDAAEESQAEEATESETAEAEESEETAEEAGEEAEESTEEAEESEETAEEAEEESELSIEESDRDYSDAAYQKAAKHYSKTLGVQLDPNDPAHRALLKENMDRGEALKRLQAEKEEKGTEEETATEEEAAPETSAKPTDEQIDQFISRVQTFAAGRVNPRTAMFAAKSVGVAIAKMFWPDKKVDFAPTQEAANEFTKALSSVFWMQLEDAGPSLTGAVLQNLGNDPVMGRVKEMAIQENAFEHLDTQKTATGQPMFPELEKMALSGALKRVMAANPFIKNIVAGKGDNPILNRAEQLKAAYKIAKGEQVNPDVVKRAVATGKKLATDKAKQIASGRVASGKSKGAFGKPPSDAERTVNELVGGGGSKFAAAVAAQAPPRER